jgi:hypothetical protein
LATIASTEPYRHWHLTNLLPDSLWRAALASVPSATDPNWIRYENDCELHKWTMEKGLPPTWAAVLRELSKVPVYDLLGVDGIQCDPVNRGAGLHLLFPGGILRPHLDYALHPCGLERRASLIYFLDDTTPETGGAFQLCDPLGRVVKEIHPQANEAVIFEGSDISYHGVSQLAKHAATRVTAACYFLAPARTGIVRQRATFLPVR